MMAITKLVDLKRPPTAAEEKAALSEGRGAGIGIGGLKRGGQLWSWGKGRDGALGQGHTRLTSAPAPVLKGTPVVDCACGDTFSLIVTEKGPRACWATGSNHGGLLGLGTEKLAKADGKAKQKRKRKKHEGESEDGSDSDGNDDAKEEELAKEIAEVEAEQQRKKVE